MIHGNCVFLQNFHIRKLGEISVILYGESIGIRRNIYDDVMERCISTELHPVVTKSSNG